MRLKISVAVIIISTATIIGLISLVVNKTTRDSIDSVASPQIRINNEPVFKDKDIVHAESPQKKHIKTNNKNIELDDFEPIETDLKNEKKEPEVELSEEDRQKINAVAKLSDAELAKEMDSLRERIESDDLFEKLEDDELSPDKKAEAKALLEKFALLGLEGTRRKYMNIEPELKDPIYAHRESLEEIRELLSDD